jgi:hypothetical protein
MNGEQQARIVTSVQERLDRILAGETDVEWRIEDRQPFAAFLSEDQREASDLAARWAAIADERGGVEGLADAVDAVSRSLGSHRPGLVEHSVKLFLTHHSYAREHLVIRSLEERQPGLVSPSLRGVGIQHEPLRVNEHDQLQGHS